MEASAAQTLLAAAQAGYGIAVVPSVLSMDKRAVKALPVLAGGRSLGRWLAIEWNAQRHQPSYLAEFVDVLASALKRDHPGREYAFAPAVEPPRSGQIPRNAP